jgi:hypothetical protein
LNSGALGLSGKRSSASFATRSDRDGSDAARSCSLVISDISSRGLTASGFVATRNRGAVANVAGNGGRGFAVGSPGAGGAAATAGSGVSIGAGLGRFSREANTTRRAERATRPAARMMTTDLAGLDMDVPKDGTVLRGWSAKYRQRGRVTISDSGSGRA